MIPVFSGRAVEEAVSPERALAAVREAFVAYARGEWSMPPKVYVPAYPAGDFRAMPALGGGHALLKWVTSFPGNPARGLPTVMGLVLLSDASNGAPVAVLDAAAVTALRTGAAAVLAAETLGRPDAASAAVIGAGVNGRAAAKTFVALGRPRRAVRRRRRSGRAGGEELGASAAASLEEALRADVVVTVTPGHEVVLPEGTLRPGQHVSLMGADGPGKAEIAVDGARPLPRLLRRLGAGEPQRRARARGRGRAAPARGGDRSRLGARGRRAGPRLGRRHHGLRLDRARDPGPRDRARRARARGRARPPQIEL